MRIAAKLSILIISILCSCQSGNNAADISTVDSNVINQGDSNPALLYLDNPNDSNFSIAVDTSSIAVDSEQVR